MEILTLKKEDIMTDLQFKSIYETFYQLLERSKNLEDAKNAIRAILGKQEESLKEEKEDSKV
jgi:hypothetical protein